MQPNLQGSPAWDGVEGQRIQGQCQSWLLLPLSRLGPNEVLGVQIHTGECSGEEDWPPWLSELCSGLSFSLRAPMPGFPEKGARGGG